MSDDLAEIVTGTDATIPATLTIDDATFIINTGAVIRAKVTSKDKKKDILGLTPVVEASPGSDWANSLIVIVFDSVNTAAVTYVGRAILEVQVDDSGKQNWFREIEIVKGTI